MEKRNLRTKACAGLLAVLLLAGMSGCGNGSGQHETTVRLTEHIPSGQTEEKHGAVTNEFREAYLDYSLRLLAESRKTGENTMVAPLCVMRALEMTRNGALGETKTQMERVLYPGLSPEQGKEGLLAFSGSLPDSPKSRFHMADSIWFCTDEDSFIPDEEFLATAAKEEQAELFGAPFNEETLADINAWVKKETEGMVTGLLDEIPDDAVMYLMDAAAYEAEWEKAYRTDQIREADFLNADGSSSQVSMMYSKESVYLSGQNVTGFIKPYADGYSFAAFLPEEGVLLEDVIGGMDGAELLELFQSSEQAAVSAAVPKFESETGAELKPALENMGMPLAFDSEKADFSAMGSSRRGNIYISRVIHKTQITVDELGTKAGAAAAVEMMTEGTALDVKEVCMDRPFFYAIVDNENQLPVFIGTVEEL